jgi:hypothetical protein
MFCLYFYLEKRDFDWGGSKKIEWGGSGAPLGPGDIAPQLYSMYFITDIAFDLTNGKVVKGGWLLQ